MSTGTRVPLHVADMAAKALIGELGNSCERVQVAGSIRRCKPDVGDIELVAVPRIETVPDGMFGERRLNRLTERIDDLMVAGILRSHPTDPKRGERYSKLLDPATGLQVDLFSARPSRCRSCGTIIRTRTGPQEPEADDAQPDHRQDLSPAGVPRPLACPSCGSADVDWSNFGLILLIRTGPADYSHAFVTAIRGRPALHVAEGQLHRGSLGCGAYVCEVVPTPEEADVFAAAGWPYRAPELRA